MIAILRNRIFIEVDEKLAKKIKKELTYTVPIKVGAYETRYVKLYDFRIVNERTLTIPIGRLDLIPDTHEIINKRIYNICDFHLTKSLTLRESQKEVYDTVEDSCIINAGCGEGKTITALSLVEKLGQKTIVIVHTKKLMDQWVEEIKNILQITPGILGNSIFNYDSNIVVAMKQTLDSKADSKLFNEFGTLIVDECHHAPAKTFNSIIDKFRSRYKIGLSATLKRKDQKQFLITNYLSSDIRKMDSGHTMEPEVLGIHSNIMLPGSNSWQGRVTALIDNMDYVSLILNTIQYHVSLGHKVLGISSRVGLLEKLNNLSNRSELVIGGSTDTNKVITNIYNNKTDIIYGSTQVMSEGISVNPLSCLVLCTPFSSDIVLEQVIGRIIRLHEGKLKPLIIDIILKGDTGGNQWRTRKRYYYDKGYNITEVYI